jgi:uncharacterized membrane protein YfcA
LVAFGNGEMIRSMIGPIKAARITGVVLSGAGIIGAVIFAALSRSLLSIVVAALVILLLSLSLFRSRKLSKEEMIRRQDRAMGKPGSDDPRKIARWMP